jgi:hypothetical protein
MNNGVGRNWKSTCGKAPWSTLNVTVFEIGKGVQLRWHSNKFENHNEKKPLIAAAWRTTFQGEEPMKSVEGNRSDAQKSAVFFNLWLGVNA